MNDLNYLLLVDPQNSFCEIVPTDQQQIVHNGELFVAGADSDMVRLRKFMDSFKESFHRIIVTVDTHQNWHIGHPIWWIDKDGKHPEPFEKIILKNNFAETDDYRFVGKREYTTSQRLKIQWATFYLSKVKTHIVWPPHCLFGTPGNNINAGVLDFILNWELTHKKGADYLLKGIDEDIEQYSAFDRVDLRSAMCGIHTPPHTHVNNIFTCLKRIFIAGEALSHCVLATINDIVKQNPALLSKMVLLSDATSIIPGFESETEAKINDLKKQGLTVAKTTDFI